MAICLMAFTGCGADADMPDDVTVTETGKGDVWVTFKISNSRSQQASRADDSEGHPEETASAAENHIDPADFTAIIMDSQNRVLKVLDEIVIEEIPGTSGAQYTVSGKINSDFLNIIGQGNSFGILCIANAQGTGGGDTFTMNLWANSLREISAMLKTYTFASSPLRAWLPDGSSNFIPMAGYRKVAALGETSGHDTPATALQLGSVTMQRAMAKVRVLDGFKYQNLPYDMRIVSVSMHCGSDRGAILPDLVQNPSWDAGTSVVEQAAAPSPLYAWRSQAHEVAFESEPGFTSDGLTYDSFVAYVPEQSVEGPEMAPYLTIITERTDADGSRTIRDHRVELSSVITPVDGDISLVRNHIYHFVTTINPPYITLNPLVYPWLSERYELSEWEEVK